MTEDEEILIRQSLRAASMRMAHDLIADFTHTMRGLAEETRITLERNARREARRPASRPHEVTIRNYFQARFDRADALARRGELWLWARRADDGK